MRRLVSVVLALTFMPLVPADAAPTVVVATGLNQPGIPATGCLQQISVTFSGTAVMDNGTLAPVSFTGRSTACTSVLSDQGDGSISGAYSGSVTYVRTNAEMRFTGWDFTLNCVYQTSVAPLHEFAVECVPGVPPVPPVPTVPTVSITGSGTYSPGLSSICMSQSVTFSGTLVHQPEPPADFTLSGGSGCETFEQGSGFHTASGDVSGNLSYTRSNIVQMTLSGTVWIHSTRYELRADCRFQPTSTFPTTSYDLSCMGSATPA